jgi:hypothetical protein
MSVVRRIGGTALTAGVATLLGAGAALGAAGHSGSYGRHYTADNEDNPGVLCRYNGDTNFSGVKVEAPFVYAVDATSGIDSQDVGWAFRVQELTDDKGASWTTIYTSAVQRATATDARDAAFTRRGKSFSPSQVHTSSVYRVQILMTWYSDGATAGRARHDIEWYHGGTFEPSFGPDGYCPGFIL